MTRNPRKLVLDNVTYLADRESLVREGGASGSDRWYAVVLDAEHGACIDARVPEGYFPTMRACHAAISRHHRSRKGR
jgi:hypothetical protein